MPSPSPRPDRSSSFADQRIRRTIATFWQNTNDPSYLRGLRENRKIEELILMMVSVATKELQKEVRQLQEKGETPDFDWKYELNLQVEQIVRILRDVLRSISSTPSELMQKLDTYADKLAGGTKASPMLPSATAGTASPTPGGGGGSTRNGGPSRPPPTSARDSNDPADMPMVTTVGTLFGKTKAELVEDLQGLKSICTAKVSSFFTHLSACKIAERLLLVARLL